MRLRLRHSPGLFWTCWFIVASIYLIQYGLMVFPASVIDTLQHQLHLTSVELGIFSSAFLVSYVLMQVPVGMMFDRFHPIKLFILSLLSMGVGCGLLIIAQGFWLGIVSRLFMGLGGSFAFVGTIYLAAEWFEPKVYPMAVGLTEAMSGIGAIIFSIIFGELGQIIGAKTILILIVILLLVLSVIVLVFVPSPKRHNNTASLKTMLRHGKAVLLIPEVWLLALYIGFTFTYFMVITNMWNIVFLQDLYHLTKAQAILDNSLSVIGFLIGGPLYGALTWYFKRQHLMTASALLLTIFIMAIHYFVFPLLIEAVLLFFIGIVTGSVVLCFSLVRDYISSAQRGIAIGFLNMFFGMFGIIMTPVVGYLYGLTHNPQVAIFPTVICSSLSIVCCLLLYILTVKRTAL